jgi:hypothetical protein
MQGAAIETWPRQERLTHRGEAPTPVRVAPISAAQFPALRFHLTLSRTLSRTL